MGIILFPPDLINEKFLINVRNCLIKLNDKHPVKKWLTSQSTHTKPDKKEQKKIDFLSEMLNSQFNLITDQKVKTEVIGLIGEVPGKTNLEKFLKSYLYLMIGNITRSDKILKTIIAESPRNFYKGFTVSPTIYHKMTEDNLEKILRKFSRHPADRLTFYLFTVYIKSFLNQPELLELVDDIEPDGMKEKMPLAYTLRNSPELVTFARLATMSEKRRMKNLRMKKHSAEMQSFWVWPFLDIDPLISETMMERIKQLDEVDPLWSIYLLENEKLSDMYFGKGGQPVSRRRTFLREHLKDKTDFMLTLYKLIEIGDIDQDLVDKVSQFMIHE
ncbi:MAG: hypothetical protein H0V66_07530 [Bdellovibrionales bacterium]|nr:hypothetical protein [Bdellovibrionales bacterium]